MIITLDVHHQFEVETPYENVYSLLSDIPASASHFPNLQQIIQLDELSFRWELNPVGPAPYTTQPVFACMYTFTPEEGKIEWAPIRDVGNVALSGYWKIEDHHGRCKVQLWMKGDLDVPIPSLMKFVAKPLITEEFKNYIRQYVENIHKTLSENE